MSEIILKPLYGLCNRMRVIDATVALAKKLDKKVSIIWEQIDYLNCPFDKIFEASKDFTVIESPKPNINLAGQIENDYYNTYSLKTLSPLSNQSKAFILQEQSSDKIIYHLEITKLFEQEYDFETLAKYEKIYISSSIYFFPNENKYKSFKPTNEVQKIINLCLKKFNSNTIGIHIRRTDHKFSIENSPLETFLQTMLQEIKTNPETNFFLATDAIEIKMKLKKIFGSKIISNDKPVDRNSVIGLQNAVSDLYCLSNTKKLYGSYGSSFSETAAQIKGIEYISIQKTR